jgi:hypothetical protein
MGNIQEIVTNGKRASEEELRTLVSALSDRNIITEKGGFIFKSRIDGEKFNFGVLPYVIEGERTHHYDIDIGGSKFNLIGFINSNLSMTILIKLDFEDCKKGLSEEDKKLFVRQYSALAEFLLKYGFPTNFKLDQISGDLLVEAGLAKNNVDRVADLSKIETVQ